MRLIVSHCSTCDKTTVPCVDLGLIHVCKSCDKSGQFVKLATYRKA